MKWTPRQKERQTKIMFQQINTQKDYALIEMDKQKERQTDGLLQWTHRKTKKLLKWNKQTEGQATMTPWIHKLKNKVTKIYHCEQTEIPKLHTIKLKVKKTQSLKSRSNTYRHTNRLIFIS